MKLVSLMDNEIKEVFDSLIGILFIIYFFLEKD
jgi:hypothetical protein